ncbi:hypothetical protein IW261DRAFT_1428157 [Armillaria novae-zelandiae]|uniref:Uncharacterized protein n=1 Tax=Armillaria novae-zelandiae TaxID=153914 RepID=A0AA39NAV5_9AGAR|nr:hypothetical protein IW261DRAFT_1428157 [Armillaria novae-zelandiae]
MCLYNDDLNPRGEEIRTAHQQLHESDVGRIIQDGYNAHVQGGFCRNWMTRVTVPLKRSRSIKRLHPPKMEELSPDDEPDWRPVRAAWAEWNSQVGIPRNVENSGDKLQEYSVWWLPGLKHPGPYSGNPRAGNDDRMRQWVYQDTILRDFLRPSGGSPQMVAHLAGDICICRDVVEMLMALKVATGKQYFRNSVLYIECDKPKVIATAIHSSAQISSLARLVYRSQRNQLYSDDACACLAMSFSLAWLACIWTPNFVDITTTEYVSCTQAIKAEPDQFIFGLDKDPAGWLSASKLTIFWISTLRRHGHVGGDTGATTSICPIRSKASAGRTSIVTEITCAPTFNFQGSDGFLNVLIQVKFLSDIVIFAVPIIGFVTRSRNHHQAPDGGSLTLSACAAATITAASIVHAIFLILGLEHSSDFITAVESAVSLMVVNIVATVGICCRQGPRCDTDFNNSVIFGSTLPFNQGHTSNGWRRLLPKPLEGSTNSIFEFESQSYIPTRPPPQHLRLGILAERSPTTSILKYGLTVPARGRGGPPMPLPAAKPVPKSVRFANNPRWSGSDPALNTSCYPEYLIDDDPFQRR